MVMSRTGPFSPSLNAALRWRSDEQPDMALIGLALADGHASF
jgi:hypothetical protein